MPMMAFDIETASVPDVERIAALHKLMDEHQRKTSDLATPLAGDPAADLEAYRSARKELDDLTAVDPRKGLGVTCIGIARDGNAAGDIGTSRTYGADENGVPTPRMTRREAHEFLLTLAHLQDSGYTPVTWNGLFDFHVLGVEANDRELAAFLCLRHVDLMFLFLSVKGFPLSLRVAAAACGSAKSTDIFGADAPHLWSEGHYDKVLGYVMQDAKATLEVARHIKTHLGFDWVSQKGRSNRFALPAHVTTLSEATVRNVLAWPDPDQSWMTNPLSRSAMTQWLRDALDDLTATIKAVPRSQPSLL